MKQKVILIFLFLLASLAAVIYDHTDPPKTLTLPPTAKPVTLTNMPLSGDIQLTDFSGKSFPLSDLYGRIIIVNFWASWCLPCATELPALLEIAAKQQDSLTLLAVSVDDKQENAEKLLKLIKTRKPDLVFPKNALFAWDPQKKIAQDVFQTTRYPESYILGTDGHIKVKIVGDDLEKLRAALDAINDDQRNSNKPAAPR
tara:strand:- start:970 stop:1569 length:600 start_codon:yes stop_codon:yes gene_type:complete